MLNLKDYPQSHLFKHSQMASSNIFTTFFFFPFLGPLPVAYGGSQARSPIGAIAADLSQSHSNTGSKQHLRPTPQLTATPDP